MPAFAAKPLGAEIDATAPDGTAVRLLMSLRGGSMAHFELPAGAVSHAVAHRSVEEIWYVFSGKGEIWRMAGEDAAVTPMRAGLTSPSAGTGFQFRAGPREPLRFLAIARRLGPASTRPTAIEGP